MHCAAGNKVCAQRTQLQTDPPGERRLGSPLTFHTCLLSTPAQVEGCSAAEWLLAIRDTHALVRARAANGGVGGGGGAMQLCII
eukprot:365564-Chlamydomonas_euryale.AAC.6